MASASVSALGTDDLLRRYLGEAAADELELAELLSSFSEDGDDEEVQQAFRQFAQDARERSGSFLDVLTRMGGDRVTTRHFATAERKTEDYANSEVIEERIAQYLSSAYALQAAECARFEVLASFAHAAGEEDLEQMVREFETETQVAAGQVWKFLASRATIAFNMLTVSEVDPSVETKVADNRLVEG